MDNYDDYPEANEDEFEGTEEFSDGESSKSSPEDFLTKYITELESHPLFNFQHDPLLSSLILPIDKIKSLTSVETMKQVTQSFGQEIHKEIFFSKTIEELHADFQKLSLVQKTLCGKLIKQGDNYFRCLDCDIHDNTSLVSLLCIDCFDKAKSKHEGHRLILVKKTNFGAATCDCGDAEVFKPEGFCPDHTFEEVNVEELLQKFPKDILERFQRVLKKAFYGVIALYEIGRKNEEDSLRNILLTISDLFLNEIISFCVRCYSQIDVAFVAILGLILKSPFIEPYNSLWHDCGDLRNEKDPSAVDITKPHACTCLVTGNLLRLGNVIAPSQQSQLQKIFTECFGLSNFKDFFPIEFTKYIYFLYNMTYTNNSSEDNSNSKLLNMKVQLYGKESLLLQIIESGYFQNQIDVMRKVIFSAPNGCYAAYHILADIRSALLYFLNPKKKSSERLLKQSDLLNEFFEILMNFQIKFFYPATIHVGVFEHNVRYSDINICLMMEKVTAQVIENGVKLVCTYPEAEKRTLMKKIMSQWHSNFMIAKSIGDEEFNTGTQSFHPALERVLSHLLRTLFGNSISVPELESFLKEALPDVKPSEVMTQVLENVLRTLGLVRYLHMAQNYETGLLWHVYYFMNNLFFELDTSTIQIMTTLVPPEELFQVVIKNYFSYSQELRTFFENPKCLTKENYLKQKVAVLRDFLHFIIFIMNDEISFLNLQLNNARLQDDVEFDARSQKILEKVCINILLNYYWTDLIQIKKAIKNVLYSERWIDDIIPKLIISDETGQKIRLKEEYVAEFDPYLFYRVPSLQANILHNVASRVQSKKDEPKVDLVSGQYSSDAPQHLKTIRKNFFQSELPEFLVLFLRQQIPETSSLVRPVLKLILMNLQVANDCHHNSLEFKKMEPKIEKCYLNQDFAKDLMQILGDQSLEDCKPCIQKIQDLLKRLSSKFEEEKMKASTTMMIEETKNQDEERKRQAMERMQKMKEKFAQKRENFSKANAELLEEAGAGDMESSKFDDSMEVEQEKVCQYCLDKVVDTEEGGEYGMPIYVAFTNNFYDINEEIVWKKQDFGHIYQADWWPVISSCNHYYHKKCFRKVHLNSRKPENFVKKNFCNPNETNCTLCKTLCNAFLCFSRTTNMEEEEGQGEETLYLSLAKDLKKLLTHKILQLCQTVKAQAIEEEKPITLKDIFWRAYYYYINSFSLNKSSRTLQQQFNLYTQFFRVLLSELKPEELELPKSSTFLDRLSQKLNLSTSNNPRQEDIVPLFQFKSESLLSEIFFDILTSFSSKPAFLEDNFVVNIHFQAPLQEYFAFKIVQLACFEQGQNFKNLESIKTYFAKSQSFQDRIAAEFLYPLQFTFLPFILNNTIILNNPPVLDRLGDLLLHSSGLYEHLDQLLHALGFAMPFNKFIESCLSSLSQKSLDSILPLNLLIKFSDITGQCKVPRVLRYAPAKIELPKTFAEFNAKYFAQKCSLCNQYSQGLLSCICLICGDVFCQAYCDPATKVFGNANRHASHYHMGLGAFLGVYDLKKTVLSAPVNTINSGKNVYIDKLGQGIQVFLTEKTQGLQQRDFKQFLLTPGYVQYYKDLIDQQSQGKETFSIAQSSYYFYNQGHL